MKKTLWALGKAALAVFAFTQAQTVVAVPLGILAALWNPSATAEELTNAIYGAVNIIALVSGVMTVAALWLVWRLLGQNVWRQANLCRARPLSVMLSAVLGVGMCLLVTIAMGLIPWPTAWMDAYMENTDVLAGEWSVLGIVATVVVAPVVEELVFRGVAYTSLKTVMPRWVAAVLVSVVFGLLHGTVIWFLYTFLLSFAMIFVYEQTRSLWGSIALHMAFNLIGQLPLMGEDPSFVSIVLVAAAGVVLTAVPGIVLYATQPVEETI